MTLLSLVSFSAKSCMDDARRTLHKLGYGVEITSQDAWLDGEYNGTASATLLLLGRKDLPSSDIVDILRSRLRSPSLAIVDRNEGRFSPEILKCCDEFLCWPCQEEELRCRLSRLLPESGASVFSGSPTALEEFAAFEMIGRSPRFLHTLSLIKRIACYDAPVLIQGETGTGKEMAARAIHYLGARREYPFTPVNCGAIPESLFENELFGHEKGAFTDARDSQLGLVAQSERGTLFLDEVESLSPKAQVTLLRFLQDFEYKPLGGTRAVKADLRVISASNTDLEKSVSGGEFRRDLWFRLHVIPLHLPSLAERPGDISLLAEYFLDKFSHHYHQAVRRFGPRALSWMNAYSWPGNVRELENFVHRALVTSDGPLIGFSEVIPDAIDDSVSGDAPAATSISFSAAKSKVIAEFERRYLGQLMQEAEGNVTRAARIAGKERRALGKLLKKHGLARIN